MFKLKGDIAEIKKMCDRFVQILDECVIEEFTEWAKQDDEYLRSNDGFIDRTGNLRSSLGAGVSNKGQAAFVTSFQTVLNGSRGSSEGRSMLERVISEYPNVIAKVMVAGMDYAQYVEDIDTKDVLESRRIQCEREAEDVMKRAMSKAESRIKAL